MLRPLVTYDKQETIALARRIGTYDLSILPYEDCCSLFVPPHPATGARLADVERAEAALDLRAEAAALATTAEVVPIGRKTRIRRARTARLSRRLVRKEVGYTAGLWT